MSYYLFGAFELNPATTCVDGIAWRIAEAASDVELFSMMGENLCHHEWVFDMLTENEMMGSGFLPVIVTGSPFRDTSDELLEDSLAKEKERGKKTTREETCESLGKWLAKVLFLKEINKFHLFTSLGYTMGFDRSSTPVQNVSRHLHLKIGEDEDIPSLWVEITRMR